VLWMLAGGPLHPYAIQSRMKAWGKDQVVNVGQRANLYKTIERLLAGGLITVSHIDRTPGFPERTSYELTEEGWRHAISWLEHMLAHPRNEFPEFPAALSFIFGLTPAAARKALDAGKVDPRLLLTLAELAGLQPVRIVAFGDMPPGAMLAVPFRSVEITIGAHDPLRAGLRSMLSFFDAQRPPYLPATAGTGGTSVLTVEYAAPSPLGLLSGS